MGRLFWKFFFSILLAQIAATAAIGGAVWLKARSTAEARPSDIETGPPAEMAIESAAATLAFGGTSSSTPLCAGVAALVLSARPDLGWSALRDLLRRTASRVDSATVRKSSSRAWPSSTSRRRKQSCCTRI